MYLTRSQHRAVKEYEREEAEKARQEAEREKEAKKAQEATEHAQKKKDADAMMESLLAAEEKSKAKVRVWGIYLRRARHVKSVSAGSCAPLPPWLGSK